MSLRTLAASTTDRSTPHGQETPMTSTRPRLRGLAGVLSAALVLTALSGCSVVDGITGSDDPSETPSASPTASEKPYDSEFTRDGTFQSHIEIDGVDFVYTLYPTKATPRTNEWYPKGKKHFTFTFQAYDLDRDLDDPFKTKRKVWLDRIRVTSKVKVQGGGTNDEHPYELSGVAKELTFDPEPLSSKRGMLITSPKGAFELRNQTIDATAANTIGIDLTFTASVHVERRAGSKSYTKKSIKQRVPIAIFPSDKTTEAQDIPVDAN
ncbi:hypothetical protein [Nocardioides sp. URHA0020]|uniref:hypothetical protein n=1 Tax=Nocardioides sp. URHA0020 TaxID=1380392 RepID=UPI00048C4B10|nr:hypothetical protein [Nocardioides sp. URHA0020]